MDESTPTRVLFFYIDRAYFLHGTYFFPYTIIEEGKEGPVAEGRADLEGLRTLQGEWGAVCLMI